MNLPELSEFQQQAIINLAEPLLGTPFSADYVGGGRNSRIYRLYHANSPSYALKVYFRQAGDARDRLGTEYNSLSFLWSYGVRNIPQPLTHYEEADIALYEYIEGAKIEPQTISVEDIDTAVDFITRLQLLKEYKVAQQLSPASEAYFSVESIYNNIQQRVNRLIEGQHEQNADPALTEFLDQELLPTLDAVIRWSDTQDNWHQKIETERCILSPSDFGFHNTIRREDELVFLDFEYFGWDIPGKFISDFLLHPAMNLNTSLSRHFAGRMIENCSDPDWLIDHVKSVYPLFAIKWCLICLNEFLPEHRRRRTFAAGANQDWDIVRTEQLSKARYIIHRIHQEHEQFPYFD
jgi:hypothetical protein